MKEIHHSTEIDDLREELRRITDKLLAAEKVVGMNKVLLSRAITNQPASLMQMGSEIADAIDEFEKLSA